MVTIRALLARLGRVEAARGGRAWAGRPAASGHLDNLDKLL
jgi:hypothetical protein